MALISADNGSALATVIMATVALGVYADTTRLGKKVSGAMILIVVGMLLSNLNIMPFSAPAYGSIANYLVPIAIPLLLFKANIREVFTKTGDTLLAFLMGAIGTILGAVIGLRLVGLGADGPALAGIFSSTYIGGSLNFVALTDITQFDDAAKKSAALAADAVAGTLYLMMLVILPSIGFLRKILHSPIIDHAEASLLTVENTSDKQVSPHEENVSPLNIVDLTLALSLSLVIGSLSTILANWVVMPSLKILFITAISVAIANSFPDFFQRLKGDFELGMVFMYLFFAVIGFGANVSVLFGSVIPMFVFALIIVFSNLVVSLIGAKLFKIDLAQVVVASNACVLGPATAAAVAASRGWHQLVTPGVLCGVFGYVIANFIGTFLFYALN